MPFKKGPAAWRRTLDYLNKCELVFKPRVKICSINYHETNPESEGLRRFVFWHLGQIQYRNPKIQCVQFKNIVESPFITLHMSTGVREMESHYINCYNKTSKEIMSHCIKYFGKPLTDKQKEINNANFGKGCSRHCICMVNGQVACPKWKPLPEFMRGKYKLIKKEELNEIRKEKPDEQAIEEYWNTA
jgi:small subunit ribosomal protein S25